MISYEVFLKKTSALLENKITLKRLGAPLLYAHDACTFINRLRGIHALPPFGPTDALIIRPCKAIHTWRLDRAIDVAFLDKRGIVLKVATVQPNSLLVCPGATIALEMAAGTAKRIQLAIGQEFVPDQGQW